MDKHSVLHKFATILHSEFSKQITQLELYDTSYRPQDGSFDEAKVYRAADKADVISFDIFDTLILRKVNAPSNIFDLMGEENNLFNYSYIRTSVEYALRAKQQHEVSLAEIYGKMPTPSPEKLMTVELNYEDQFIVRNDFMYKIYRHLKDSGKTIIFTSDMYLPEFFIRKKLTDSGYDENDHLYLSSSQLAQKVDGTLFELLKKQYPGKSILHIGDNFSVDYLTAKKHGLSAIYYPNIHERWNKQFTLPYSPICGSVYKALSDIMQYTREESELYTVGYSFFGFVVLGYVQHIYELSQKHGNAPVIFAARDMKIVSEIFKLLHPDAVSFYARCSRFSLMRADYFNQKNRLLDWLYENNGCSLKETLKSVNLSPLFLILKNHGLPDDVLIDKTNRKKIYDALEESEHDILALFRSEHENAIRYFSAMRGKNNHLIFVDLSGKCTSGIAVQNLLNETAAPVKVIHCQLYSDQKSSFIGSKLNSSLFPYLFSDYADRHIAELFFAGNNWQNTPYMESIFSENEGSLISYHDIQNWHLSAEKNDGSALDEIHQGIRDFCTDYNDTIGLGYTILRSDCINALLSGLSYFSQISHSGLIISNNSQQ